MSVITFPRRVDTRPSVQRRRVEPKHHVTRRSLLQRWRSRSNSTKMVALALVALSIVLVGNSYAAERQVEIHQLQTSLLKEQAAYSAQVAALTNTAAPARVASQAGRAGLVVPTLVSQIATVPLTVPLPLPQLGGSYRVQSRIYK